MARIEGFSESAASSFREMRDTAHLQQPQHTVPTEHSARTLSNTRTRIIMRIINISVISSKALAGSRDRSTGILSSWLITFTARTSEPMSAPTRVQMSDFTLNFFLPLLERQVRAATAANPVTNLVVTSTNTIPGPMDILAPAPVMYQKRPAETIAETSPGFRSRWRIDIKSLFPNPIGIESSNMAAKQIVVQALQSLRWLFMTPTQPSASLFSCSVSILPGSWVAIKISEDNATLSTSRKESERMLGRRADLDTMHTEPAAEEYSAPAEIRSNGHPDLQHCQHSTSTRTSARTIVNTKSVIIRILSDWAGSLMSTPADSSVGIFNSWFILCKVKTSKPTSPETWDKVSKTIFNATLPQLETQVRVATSTVISLGALAGSSLNTMTFPARTITEIKITPRKPVVNSSSFSECWRVDIETFFLQPIATATSIMAVKDIIVLTLLALRKQLLAPAPALTDTTLSCSVNILPGSWVEIVMIEKEQEVKEEAAAAALGDTTTESALNSWTEFQPILGELMKRMPTVSESTSPLSNSFLSLREQENERLERAELERMARQMPVAEE